MRLDRNWDVVDRVSGPGNRRPDVTAALRELATQVDGESKAARRGLLSRLLASGAKKGSVAKKG